MTAVPQIASGAGFRYAQVLEFGSGYTSLLPKGASPAGATSEQFLQLSCAKSFNTTFPDAQIISHTGDDGICGVMMLPPNETVSIELSTGKTNLTADALLQGLNVVTLGDMVALVQGAIPQRYIQVGMLFYRQAIITDPASSMKGGDCWIWAICPKTKVAPKKGPWEEGGADENAYTVLPQVVKRHLWGIDFAVVTEGTIAGQIIYGICYGPPKFVSWTIDAVPLLVLDLPESAKLQDGSDTDYAVKVFRVAAADGTVTDITATSTLTDPDEITIVGGLEDDVIYAFYERASE